MGVSFIQYTSVNTGLLASFRTYTPIVAIKRFLSCVFRSWSFHRTDQSNIQDGKTLSGGNFPA
tara:strand:- start:1990 stop:2178 length:189 start_codon:yes stop_codon:yes gene_type:complete